MADVSAVLPLLLRAAGASLLTAGAIAAVDSGRRRQPVPDRRGTAHPRRRASDGGGSASRRAGRLRAGAAAVAIRYDRSRPGRRLRARLEAAAVELEPWRWRRNQAAVAVAAVAGLTLVTGSLSTGMVVGGTGSRLAGWALLRARRNRADELLEEDAAVLARHLATELAAGASPVEAVAALRGGEQARQRPRLASLAAAVLARTAGGDGLASALGRSIAGLSPGRGRDAMASVATALDLVVGRGSGTAVLARVADALEWRRRTRAEVHALSAEVRMAALAIPALTAAAAVMLATSDATILAVVLSPGVGAISLLLMGMVVAGTVAVRRATAPP